MSRSPITLQEQQMTGCDFPATMQGEREHQQPEALKLPNEKFEAHLSFAIPVVLIHRADNPTSRWHLDRNADKLAPTCGSTKSFQSRQELTRQEPCGEETPEESAITPLPPSSLLIGSCCILTRLRVHSWLLPGASGRRGRLLLPKSGA